MAVTEFSSRYGHDEGISRAEPLASLKPNICPRLNATGLRATRPVSPMCRYCCKNLFALVKEAISFRLRHGRVNRGLPLPQTKGPAKGGAGPKGACSDDGSSMTRRPRPSASACVLAESILWVCANGFSTALLHHELFLITDYPWFIWARGHTGPENNLM